MCNCIYDMISIHTFLVEGDTITATKQKKHIISIHTFLVEGDKFYDGRYSLPGISIHTFLVEGDLSAQQAVEYGFVFQSTPSLWKATTERLKSGKKVLISIHTFLVEGDRKYKSNYK